MTYQMSFSLFPTIDSHKKEQSPDTRNPALSSTPWRSTVVRVGARVALQQRSILRTNTTILSWSLDIVPAPPYDLSFAVLWS